MCADSVRMRRNREGICHCVPVHSAAKSQIALSPNARDEGTLNGVFALMSDGSRTVTLRPGAEQERMP